MIRKSMMSCLCFLALAAVIAETWAGRASIAWLPDPVRAWDAEMRQAAERHGVPSDLLAIVVLVESRGNPDAESSRGALGLMQVMPITGERIAERRGIADFRVDQLRDPATNLDYGAWYLARQLSMTSELASGDEAIALAAAAYNGGPAHVRAHLADGAALSQETARYSDLVRRLWQDRHAPRSETFEDIWRSSIVQ